MLQIPRKTEQWFKALLAAVITGGANAGLGVLGIGGANAVGITVQPLNFRQLGVILLSGAVVGALAYLAKSPVPPDNGDTQHIEKP